MQPRALQDIIIMSISGHGKKGNTSPIHKKLPSTQTGSYPLYEPVGEDRKVTTIYLSSICKDPPFLLQQFVVQAVIQSLLFRLLLVQLPHQIISVWLRSGKLSVDKVISKGAKKRIGVVKDQAEHAGRTLTLMYSSKPSKPTKCTKM